MRAIVGFVPEDRRAWHRDKLLALLGDESLVQRVERAENDYLFMVPQLAAVRETDKDIQRDLKDLAAALATLHRIFTLGGSAKALFEGLAFKYAGADVLQRLRDTVGHMPGEVLVMAANETLQQFQPRQHRQPDPITAERLRLVGNVAYIAKDAGIKVKRSDPAEDESEFHQLVGYVFDRLNIDMDPDGFIRRTIEENRAIP